MKRPSENHVSDGFQYSIIVSSRKLLQPNRPLLIRRCGNLHPFPVFQTLKRQCPRVQHQAVGAQVFGHGVVLAQVAVVGVTDDGVENVFHVAAQLVFAAGMRGEFCP